MDIVNEFDDQFSNQIDSKMNVKIDYEKKCVDFTWLDIFEDSMRYIDNILRNPKRFIINEEEIVKVELSKKITVESVIHLTQHTNYIQDYDPKNGDVRPSKVLNINKEESLDTYENRFIHTLIKQMNMFLDKHIDDILKGSYCNDNKEIKYNAKAKIDDEEVNLSLKLDSTNNQMLDSGERNGVSVQDRIKKIKTQMSGFMGTELMVTLDKLHVPDVRPPIRKTNVLLKNPNFIKALEVFNYLQNYNKNNYSLEKQKEDYMDTGFAKEQFDESFLLGYLVMNSISEYSAKHTKEQVTAMTVGKIIDAILDNNENITKKDLDELINKEYKKSKNKIKKRDDFINDILNEKFDKVYSNFRESCNLLEG